MAQGRTIRVWESFHLTDVGMDSDCRYPRGRPAGELDGSGNAELQKGGVREVSTIYQTPARWIFATPVDATHNELCDLE